MVLPGCLSGETPHFSFFYFKLLFKPEFDVRRLQNRREQVAVAQMKRRFLLPKRVSHQPRDPIEEEMVDAAMARVLNLRDVFELVIDQFTNAAFAPQQLVELRHQMLFHPFLEFGDELHAVGEKLLEQGLRDIPFVAEKFAKQVFD